MAKTELLQKKRAMYMCTFKHSIFSNLITLSVKGKEAFVWQGFSGRLLPVYYVSEENNVFLWQNDFQEVWSLLSAILSVLLNPYLAFLR